MLSRGEDWGERGSKIGEQGGGKEEKGRESVHK